jgi:hypothetical protein
MSLINQFINVNDQLYRVKRIVREEHVKNVDAAKEVYYSEHVFRRDGYLYYCEMVQDLEIIPDEEVTKLEISEQPQEQETETIK